MKRRNLLAALMAAAMAVARAQEPGFADTIDFVRRSLDTHGDFRDVGGGSLRIRLSDVLGKRLRVRSTFTAGTPGAPERSETTEYSLADLDPSATHVRLWFVGGRRAYAVWLADSGRGGIRTWPEGNEDLGAQPRPAGWIGMDDETLARALAKAVNHAIRLAGGKAAATADAFFGAAGPARAVPESPVTGEVHHVVSLDDAVALLRERIRGAPSAYPSLPADDVQDPLPAVALSAPALVVTVPAGGSGFATNHVDAVRFDRPAAAKGRGIAALLAQPAAFVGAGLAPMRNLAPGCVLVPLSLAADQLEPLGARLPAGSGVLLQVSAGDGWPDGEAGFVWLARADAGVREWRARVVPMRRVREFGPDSVRAAASGLGVRPAAALIEQLAARAKAERRARREDR
jgi:hypothetical protein